jgi:hypothetical protein
VRTWHELAWDLFPTLHEQLADSTNSLYELFSALDMLLSEAHGSQNRELLARIYFFGEWCLASRDPEVSNAAGVAFWEHVFDDWLARFEVIPYLSPRVIADISPLWEWCLSAEKVEEIKGLVDRRRERIYLSWQDDLAR